MATTKDHWFLFDFFCRVRSEIGIDLSIDQYLDFGKTLTQFYDGTSLSKLLEMCKILWLMKPEIHSTKLFEVIFYEEVIKELKLLEGLGEENDLSSEAGFLSENLEDRLETKRPENKKNESVEKGVGKINRNQPKPKKISAWLNLRDFPSGSDSGTGSLEHIDHFSDYEFIFSDLKLPIRARDFQQNWQYLRGKLKQKKSYEIDIPATVTLYAKHCVIVKPIQQKEKTQHLNIVMLIDQYGSMTPYISFYEQIVKNIRQAIPNADTSVNTYYFHNYPSDVVFARPGLYEPIKINSIFQSQQMRSADLLLIVSDAGALNKELSSMRIHNMYELRELCLERNSKCKILWFNPLPASRLMNSSSSKILASIYTMISADEHSWKKLPNLLRSVSNRVSSQFEMAVKIYKDETACDIPLLNYQILSNSEQLTAQVKFFMENEVKRSPRLFWFVAHAAFFPILTPNLLHKIWLNFQEDVKEKTELIEIADILKSTLCRPIANNIYQIHPLIREIFLSPLIKAERFGPSRLRELALFLKQYDLRFGNSEFYSSSLRTAIKMTYWSELNPDLFGRRIKQMFEENNHRVDSIPELDKFRPILSTHSNFGESGSKIGVIGSLAQFSSYEQNGIQEEAMKSFQTIKDHFSTLEEKDGVYVYLDQRYYELLKPDVQILKSLLNLDYKNALTELAALTKGYDKLPVLYGKVFLELLYLFGHTKNEKIFGDLREMINHFYQDVIIDPIDSSRIDASIKKIDLQLFEKLQTRYFPNMIPVPGGQPNKGSARQKREPAPIINFSIAETPTTWWQYSVFLMANNKKLPELTEWHRQGNHPAVMIGWEDARDYTSWLNRNELGSNRYYLPWESEWVLAAKSGGEEEYTYAGSNKLDEVGWFKENSSILGEKGEVLARQTQRVKLKRSNKLGLYDMSGNVWEWCRDDAFGSKQKVVKGGAWLSKANECAIDHKNSKEVYAMHYAIGFRVIKNLD